MIIEGNNIPSGKYFFNRYMLSGIGEKKIVNTFKIEVLGITFKLIDDDRTIEEVIRKIEFVNKKKDNGLYCLIWLANMKLAGFYTIEPIIDELSDDDDDDLKE